MKPWQKVEDERIRTLYSAGVKIGDMLGYLPGRSVSAIRNRCSTLGLTDRIRPWSVVECAELAEIYRAAGVSGFLSLTHFCEKWGRENSNVCRKAREMGLGTSYTRPKAENRKGPPAPKYATDEERRAATSARLREWHRTHQHPRGALGHKHDSETLDRLAEASRQSWAKADSPLRSDEMAQARSDAMYMRMSNIANRTGRSRGKGGRRADLGGMYLRSSWEANYARYLNWMVAQGKVLAWQYEPKVFHFSTIKRGQRSYTPDFRVVFPDERVEWHEVKGFMDDKSRVKLDRMRRFYPEEVVVVVDADWFSNAKRSGLDALVGGWE